MADWNGWDLDQPGSRFTHRIEFVIGVGDFGRLEEMAEDGEEVDHDGDLDEWDVGYRRYSREVLSELTGFVSDARFRAFDTSYCRGAEVDALGLTLDWVARPGALAATAVLVKRMFDHLRRKGYGLTMSLGAAEHYCLADLLLQDSTLDPGSIRTLLVTEASRPGPPTELNHTSLDMFTVIFQDSEDTRSWVYLIHCDGKILHRSEGDPIPEHTLGFL